MGHPRLAKLTALAATVATLGLADVGAAHAAGGWLDFLQRLWSWSSGGNTEAEFKRADQDFKRQGGSRVIIRLDTDALRDAMLIELRDDVRRNLREGRVPHAGMAIRDGRVEVRIREAEDRTRAHSRLASLNLWGDGAVAIADSGEGSIVLKPTEATFDDHVRRVRRQSIEVIERRLDHIGVTARGGQPDGLDRILVLLPGVKDPERLSAVFNARARVAFRLVDMSMTPDEALRGNPPPASEIVYERNTKIPLLLHKQVLLDGSAIADAAPGFDQRTNDPIVTFRFNARGTQAFALITQENIGRPFAIVLDNDVISAPIIREPILGGSGQISGNFTVQDADAIATLMRSGTLPGRLTVVEQQVVEPGTSAQH